ncbi:hypothetical protein [Streptococcus sp. A12]|uniref:hypothetical protein n=1 Tax=Streptococcus sp. A12 TaxID=1759399 RepID=UPI0025EF5201|nr:hypothetical protein [Streptococcus sp. A12]
MDYKNNNDKELARNVLSKYRSFCRVARVDFLTGNLLDGCADQQNKLQNMALIEINKIRKAIEGIPLAMDKSILEMSYIEQKKVSTSEQMIRLSISSSNYHRRKARALLEFIEHWQSISPTKNKRGVS